MSASEQIELDPTHAWVDHDTYQRGDDSYPHSDDEPDVRTPLSQHLSPRSPLRSHSSSPSHYPSDPLSPNPSAKPKGSDVHPEWRRHIYLLLEVPTSSPAAFLMHVFITALIAVSAVVTVLETVPEFHSISPAVWFGVESALVALFTIEYVARCVAHSTTWRTAVRWFVSFFGIIDALAVIPYYIEIALHQDTSILFRFSILRMFRLLRVFKPFRYNSIVLLTIEVMYLSVRRSQHALLAIAFFVVMVLTVFSTLLYFAERGAWDPILETFVNTDGDPSQFASIPAAAWFVLVTITTVGYGEITPRSFLGRLVTLPLLVFGLLLIALPSFVLGREFSLVWERMAGQGGRFAEAFGGANGGEHADHWDPLDSPVEPTHRTNHRREASSLGSMLRRSEEVLGRSEANLLGRTTGREADALAHLSAQVGELRGVVERQTRLLERLLGEKERERRKGKGRAEG
ncbi:voltage-gated potassium channel [Schizophyllum commune H4-8]|uniref:voltage-gated potassium channel n=1 Tax=Schizophyllum commune (strain H4-8 / FGSC 9210) TaxID=578458 RepID=UPI002160E1B0|nr:voltage-gated potassium channel [Schizophyllum commune H4-8]KAI5895554.1 voltage-gated potassium channel [Schizophyllum commune H4-8]